MNIQLPIRGLFPAELSGLERIIAILGLAVFLVLLINLVSWFQKRLDTFHMPTDRPATSLERWWDGIRFVDKKLYQYVGLFLYSLLLIAGIMCITVSEIIYYYNPGLFPKFYEIIPTDGVSIVFMVGLLFVSQSLRYWKEGVARITGTSGLDFHLKRFDSYLLLGLSGISVVFILLSLFHAAPKAWNCALLSFVVAVLSIGLSVWMFSGKYLDQTDYSADVPKPLLDRTFKFSKAEDDPQASARDSQEVIPDQKPDASFHFSEIEDSSQENNGDAKG